MSFTILLAFAAFFISLLGTRLVILALRKKTVLLDIPNLRSNHLQPTPKGGGLAVIFSIIICGLIADLNYAIVLSMLILAAVSLLDDLIEVPAIVRLLVQAVAVTIALSLPHAPLCYGYLPVWADNLLIGMAWVWFINLFNFMDGIDGLSSAEMITIGGGLALVAAIAGIFPNELSAYGLIVTAAAFGFYWWNRHPAKIFLGDVGSIPVGFFLGYLLLLAIQSGYGYTVLILPAYYLTDSTLTLMKRLLEGKKIWVAHSEHYYQKAVRAGWTHDGVVRAIMCLNIILIYFAVQAVLTPGLVAYYVGAAYILSGLLVAYFARIYSFNTP